MCRVLFTDVRSKEELKEALDRTFQYYIDEYPQTRFGGKTAGQVRKEADAGQLENYPIKLNSQIVRFWKRVNSKKATAQA